MDGFLAAIAVPSLSTTAKSRDMGYQQLTVQQVKELKDACDRKLAEYVAKRGDAIWEHSSCPEE
jgi:hypothetical protein